MSKIKSVVCESPLSRLYGLSPLGFEAFEPRFTPLSVTRSCSYYTRRVSGTVDTPPAPWGRRIHGS